MILKRAFIFEALLALVATSAFAGGVGVYDVDLDLDGLPATGWLDLSNASMILTNPVIATYDTTRWWLAQGFDFGSWDGYGPYGIDPETGDLLFPSEPGGIISANGAASGGSTMLGLLTGQQYMDNWSNDFYGYDVTGHPDWILVKYTWGGDSNFSGTTDIDDYGFIDWANKVNFDGNPGNDVPNDWLNGDYNYSGVIDIDDYGIIDWANQHGGTEPIDPEPLLGGNIKPVPEPSTIVLVLSALAFAFVIRRRFV